MAGAIVQVVGPGGASTAATSIVSSSITVSAGNTLWVIAISDDATITSISDSWSSGANTYTERGSVIEAAILRRLHHATCQIATGGTGTVTVNLGASVSNRQVWLVEISGTAGGYLNQGTATDTGNNPTTQASATNASQPLFAVAAIVDYQGGTPTVNTINGAAATNGGTLAAGGQLGGLIEYRAGLTTTGTNTADFGNAGFNRTCTVFLLLSEASLAPTINTKPTDQTAFVGGSVTFTSSATASAGSLTWAWQDNSGGSFANISTGSASPAPLSVGPVTAAMNGRRYRIQWTDSNGTITSSEATLFVRSQIGDSRLSKRKVRAVGSRWTWAGYANEKLTQRGWFSRDIVLPIAAGGGSSLPVGTATETDTALPLGSARPAGLSAETDTAFARTATSIRAAGLAAETDAALALTPSQIRATGLATETDTALALAGVQLRAAGLATETDTAFALSAVVGTPAGLASETDTAFALSAVHLRAVGLATETDTALALSAAAGNQVGAAAETDTATALAGVQLRATGLSAEADSALALAATQIRAIGLATETDSALARTGVQIAGTGLATETDTALQLFAGGAAAVGLATETDTALALEAVSIPQIVIPQTSFSEFSGAVVKTKQEPKQPRLRAPKTAKQPKQAQRVVHALPVGMAVETAGALALQAWVVQRGLMRTGPAAPYPQLIRAHCAHCGAPVSAHRATTRRSHE